jgi:hypothetical protein
LSQTVSIDNDFLAGTLALFLQMRRNRAAYQTGRKKREKLPRRAPAQHPAADNQPKPSCRIKRQQTWAIDYIAYY